MQCNSCGASAKSSDLFCEFCDSDLKAQLSDHADMIRELENRSLTDDESKLFLSMRDLSRKIRKSRFKFSDLEMLVDLDEDISAIGSSVAFARFVELLRLVYEAYVQPSSIALFGQNKLLFQKYF